MSCDLLADIFQYLKNLCKTKIGSHWEERWTRVSREQLWEWNLFSFVYLTRLRSYKPRASQRITEEKLISAKTYLFSSWLTCFIGHLLCLNDCLLVRDFCRLIWRAAALQRNSSPPCWRRARKKWLVTPFLDESRWFIILIYPCNTVSVVCVRLRFAL